MAGRRNSGLGEATAARLVIRAGLGPDPSWAGRLTSLTADSATGELVAAAAGRKVATTHVPAWAVDPLPEPGARRAADPEQRRLLARQFVTRGLELQAWWLEEMLETPDPLAERMTLFWHGHFTSGLREVRAPQLLLRQNALLRQHALGNYRELLHAVVRDPAMLLYLDNQQNRKGAPNENFARELLELFTLGEGHYTESDVREAARAFTGWRMRPPDGRFVVAHAQHDDGEKRFLGAAGRFDGGDVIERILAQPRAAEFVVEKLWRDFVSPAPDARQVRDLARSFRRDYAIAPLVQSLLAKAVAQAPREAGQLVKSPVEFVVGTLRALDLPLPPTAAATAVSQLGQTLFAPPNVRGWPGGTAWITTESLLARREFILALSGEPTVIPEGNAVGKRLRAGFQRATARLGPAFEQRAESLASGWVETRLLVRPSLMPLEAGATPSQRLQAALLDPVYHLK